MRDLATKNINKRMELEITDGFKLLELGRDWLKWSNPVVAIELLNSAAESTESIRNKSLQSKIFKELGRAMMMQSKWDDATMYFERAQAVFIEIGEFEGAAECVRNQANMEFQQGNYSTSKEYCEQALEWASESSNHELRATILNTLGAIKSATGDKREAVKIFMLCLADFKASGNIIRQGYVLLNIGLSQIELGEFEMAGERLNEALSIAFSEHDQQLVEICYQNKVKCHLEQKEYALAKSISEIARKILPGLNSLALEMELNLLEARICKGLGDIDSAEKLLLSLFERAALNNLSQLQADILLEQGKLYKLIGKPDLAIYKLDTAINMYRQIGIDSGLQKAVLELDSLVKPVRSLPNG